MQQGQVVRVRECRLAVGDVAWDWAARNGDGIAAHWRTQLAKNPAFFNGGIQILTGHRISDGIFHGDFATTDFASFIHWRGLGYADERVRDCFGCAILRSAEGYVLLGRQAAGNLNSGRAYCPGGFIDPTDIRLDRTIDIDGSVEREIHEETGLDVTDLKRTSGFIIVAAEASIAIGIEYRSPLSAVQLRSKIIDHIQRQVVPELADILIIRHVNDIHDVRTTSYVEPLINALFEGTIA